MEFLKAVQDKGITRFTDGNQAMLNALSSMLRDSNTTITAQNIGLPAGILQTIMTPAIEVLTAKRTADEVIGPKQKITEWHRESGVYPIVETTGASMPYSDDSDGLDVGLNAGWEEVKNYRFEQGITIGELENLQYEEAKINYIKTKFAGAAESLAIDFNKYAFFGFKKDGIQIIDGLLTSTKLNDYEQLAKWDGSDFDTIKEAIGKVLRLLEKQSGANVNPRGDKIKIAMPTDYLSYLSLAMTQQGKFLITLLKEAFPNLEFVGSPELELAHQGQNVLVAIAENNRGGRKETCVQGFSELGRLHKIAQGTSSYRQKMSSGSLGFIPFKPSYIVRGLFGNARIGESGKGKGKE